mgnify:CR=1 FL=1
MSDTTGLPVITYLSMDPVTSTVGSSQVLAYVERLATRGLTVELVTFEDHLDRDLQRRLAHLGVIWRPQKFGRPGASGGLSRVLRAARILRGVALVHARSDMAAASVMLAGIDRWVWDVRSLWVDQKVASGVVRLGSPPENAMRWVERRAARRSTAVVALTGSAINELDRRYAGVVSSKARVVTTCTDLERFGVSPLPPLPLRVLLAGTLNRYYDVPAMLDLISELRRKNSVELIVASPEDTAWETELERAEAVRISATPEEMVDLVSSCHVGLSMCRDDAGPSLLAAMPTKVGEFLASGRPVVVNPGLIDAAGFVERYKCGLVFGRTTSVSTEAAVDQLELLLADPMTPERCRSLAEAQFDLEWGVDQLVETYSSLIESNG